MTRKEVLEMDFERIIQRLHEKSTACTREEFMTQLNEVYDELKRLHAK